MNINCNEYNESIQAQLLYNYHYKEICNGISNYEQLVLFKISTYMLSIVSLELPFHQSETNYFMKIQYFG